MDNEQKIFVSYDEFHQFTIQLADKIKYLEIDYIVAPVRGGLLPGNILSHYLKKDVLAIQWSTRDFNKKIHCSKIKNDLNNGLNLLLVDDINDSGRTFIELIEDWNYDKLTSKGNLITTSIFQRYNTKLKSDYFSKLINDDRWVIFPWEA